LKRMPRRDAPPRAASCLRLPWFLLPPGCRSARAPEIVDCDLSLFAKSRRRFATRASDQVTASAAGPTRPAPRRSSLGWRLKRASVRSLRRLVVGHRARSNIRFDVGGRVVDLVFRVHHARPDPFRFDAIASPRASMWQPGALALTVAIIVAGCGKPRRKGRQAQKSSLAPDFAFAAPAGWDGAEGAHGGPRRTKGDKFVRVLVLSGSPSSTRRSSFPRARERAEGADDGAREADPVGRFRGNRPPPPIATAAGDQVACLGPRGRRVNSLDEYTFGAARAGREYQLLWPPTVGRGRLGPARSS